ncbi:AAA family ATPase, partial [Salmonella enterica]|nr:AAA family ATPase [Salmonella enterica]
MIRGIGIQNFRSFVDRTFIDIKPITVFVGKNSSGKSS